MNKAVKDKWLAALRSGEYKQGQESLHVKGEDGEPDKFCCLGVLCDLAVKDGLPCLVRGEAYDGSPVVTYDGDLALLPTRVMNWAGLDSINPAPKGYEDPQRDSDRYRSTLASYNDMGMTFPEIANLIEEYL